MIFRIAKPIDIKQILIVRNSVNENKLSNPASVSIEDCLEYLTERGKGWVCEIENMIIGFAIIDLKENNIWALFVHPNYDKQGIGKQLHHRMINWYYGQSKNNIWLSTDTKTRAELFYRKLGWKEVGILENGEIKFEMTYEIWNNKNRPT